MFNRGYGGDYSDGANKLLLLLQASPSADQELHREHVDPRR
jgi:hypothetical protein